MRYGSPRAACAAEPLESRTLLAASMVADLGTVPSSSAPRYFTAVGDSTFFTAGSDTFGKELWKTDGTAAGTTLVKDVSPGGGDTLIKELTASAGRLFFFGNDGGFGRALWVSDGTDAGTVKLKSIGQESPGVDTNGRTLTDVDGTVFFTARGPVGTSVLWKSDGTPAGTVPLKTFPIPGAGEAVAELTNVDGTLFFRAADPAAGLELWKSDGTEAGTVRVKDLNPGPAGSEAARLTAMNGRLYFTASGSGGGGLWTSDGTEAGTVLQQSAYGFPAPRGELLNLDGTLYVAGFRSLWKSDGTVAGTVQVSDRVTGVVQKIVGSGGKVYVVTHDGSGGQAWEVWVSDGTAAGTRVALRIGSDSGAAWADGFGVVAHDGAAYLPADDGAGFGVELWKTDGTPAGTGRLADLWPGPGDGMIRFAGELASAAGRLYFLGNHPATGYEPWVSDGTPAGTRLLRDLATYTGGSSPSGLTDVGGTLFFAARTEPGPAPALWKSDGTAAGTVLVQGATDARTATSGPTQLTGAPGQVFFVGWDWELWRSDGTAAGTVRLTDLDPFSDQSLRNLVALEDRLLFLRGVAGGSELWSSDGTPAGTAHVALLPDPNNLVVPSLTRVGDAVYFGASDGAHGYELWRSDGTAAGTGLFKDLVPGPGGSAPVGLTDVNGTLFFFTDDLSAGFDLWKSDGTEAGTVKVRDLDPMSFWSYPTAVGDALFFAADAGGTTGLELWKSDGTAAGTGLVKDIHPGTTNGVANGSIPRYLTESGGRLYFTAYAPGLGFELWRSDGTAAGTVMVKDIAPGPGDSVNHHLYSRLFDADGTLYFVATDEGSNYELWQSDGTADGTRRVHDVHPTRGGDITAIGSAGGVVFFTAADEAHGSELWRVDPPRTAAVVGRHVFYNRSGFDGDDPASNAADDAAIATDKNALPAGQDRLPGFDNVTSFDKGINGVMVDVAGLPPGRPLGTEDFDFGGALRPVSVTVRRGAGVNNSDRVTLVWTDYSPGAETATMATANGWLTVTVKANERTGLAAADVFSFGNLVGETGDAAARFQVTALDLAAVKRNLGRPTPVTSATDFNRDGKTNALDVAVVKRSLTKTLEVAPLLPAPGEDDEAERARGAWVSGLLE